MDQKRVLVTGIGGNVGQGILRNIIATGFPIELFGCNTLSFSAGNHFCKKCFSVPYAFDPLYILEINKIVSENSIDLIIPSTDYEVYYLSKNRENLLCELAASGETAADIYLDKYKTYLHFKKYSIPFAESALPGQYKNEFKEIIVKPRKGRGSRGLEINPKDLSGFKDDEYMVQELHRGREITTAFYVNEKAKLHGQITMERTLENGTTVQCSVIKDFDAQLMEMLEKIIASSDIKGAANVQSIVTPEGSIFPFEVNCRISGTNSIRSNFGFKDVLYTLQEYLYKREPDKPVISHGHAVRVLMDIIYPGNSGTESSETKSYIF